MLLSALAALGLPGIGPLPAIIALTVYALLPIVLITGIATNCTAVLNTQGRFARPALAPVAISAAIGFASGVVPALSKPVSAP